LSGGQKPKAQVPLIESVSKLLVFAEEFDYDRRKQRRRRKR
jgi:hypothetical protein